MADGTIYLLYVEGELGIHRGKPTFKRAFNSLEEANTALVSELINKKPALIVHKALIEKGETK